MASKVTSLPAPALVRPAAARDGAAAARRRRKRGTLAAEPGVWIVPHKLGKRAVTRAELREAELAVRALPAQDIAILAASGVKVHLYPAAGLEDGLLGATTVLQDQPGGPWRPTKVRVATRAGLSGEQSMGEIVQHELGHAVAVLRSQDRSEEAAEAYARRY